jgi:excisionase family DNA binding protein
MSNPDEMLDAVEVGKLLKLHPRTVRRLAKAGKIPSYKMKSGAVRFNWRAVRLSMRRRRRP